VGRGSTGEKMVEQISNAERYRAERNQQVKERRESIINTAQALFLEKGIVNTTMLDIAREAHISKVTLYRYFPSRDPIVFEVAVRMLGQIAETATRNIPENVTGVHGIRTASLNMIREFDSLQDAFHYFWMFDHLYSREYPSEELAQWFKQGMFQLFSQQYPTFRLETLNDETREEAVTLLNTVMSFLMRMAARGELMGVEQEVPLRKQIRNFESIIHHCFESFMLEGIDE
jgi:AcrR family transcriptional regulator